MESRHTSGACLDVVLFVTKTRRFIGMTTRRRCGAVLSAIAIAFAAQGAELRPLTAQTVPALSADARAPGRAIVFLSSEHPSWPTAQLVIQGFREALQDSPNPLALYEEFLDTSRFPRAEHVEGLRRWLAQKYDGRRVDLVVAAGQEAVEFLASGNPWPGAPVLYSDVGPLASDLTRSLPAAEELIFQDPLSRSAGGYQEDSARHRARGVDLRRVARRALAVSRIRRPGARLWTRPRTDRA